MTQIRNPNSTCRRPHERRASALERLKRNWPILAEVNRKDRQTELDTLIQRVAMGDSYKTTSNRKRPRKHQEVAA